MRPQLSFEVSMQSRLCLDCNSEADAGGVVCRFCTGESIERYDAEDGWKYNPATTKSSTIRHWVNGVGPELYYGHVQH